jgi:hypothetical protein
MREFVLDGMCDAASVGCGKLEALALPSRLLELLLGVSSLVFLGFFFHELLKSNSTRPPETDMPFSD